MAGDQLRRLLSRFWPALAVVAVALVLEPMPAGIALQGLIVGLVGALVAVGMALIYQSNRIVNFAQADLGVVPAVIAVSAAVYGGVSWFVAVPVGLVIALALGCVVEQVIIRRFRQAPRLVLMVATIGLAQFLAAASLFIPAWWHKNPTTLQLHVPVNLNFTLRPLVFTADHVLAAVVAPAILLGLAAALRFTNVGVAIRASADRADRARLLGVDVDGLQTVVWVTAAVLSFVGLILRTGILGLGIGSSLSLDALLAALTALVLGGLTDLGAVTASAVALGLLEAGVVWNHPRSPGLIAPVYAIVLVGCLLLQRSSAGRRVTERVSTWRLAEDARALPASIGRLREVRTVRWVLGAAIAAFVVALPHLLGPGSREKATAVVVFAIVTLSLVVLTGWAGQVSLGQMSFAAVGAVAGAHATQVWHADMAVALPFAGLVGIGVALVVGLPALRLRGLFLAVTTLAFALATSYLFVDNRFSWVPTGRVDRPTLLGGSVLNSQYGYYYLCVAVIALAVLGVRGLSRARTGRVLRAARENDTAAQAFGISVARARLTAFALSGFLAAVAGCLLVHLLQSFAPATYTPEQSFVVFTAAVVGGLGSVLGGVLGAVFLKGGEWLLPDARWQALTTAVGVLVVLWIVPGGLADLLYRLRDRFAHALARRHETDDDADERLVIDLRDDAQAAAAAVSAGLSRRESNGKGTFLSCRDVEVAYGPTRVLFGVDFDVGEGEIVALVGTNGAGKSTLAKAISGILPVNGGEVYFAGHPLKNLSPRQIAARGVRLLPGGEGTFPSLTVGENLRVAGWFDKRKRPQAVAARTEQVLQWFPVLRARIAEPAANLSGGEQQMLALGMVLLGAPRLLVIDEFDLGLAPTVVAKLLPIIEGLRDRGMTIVLVEQSLTTALTLAESAYFMEKGRILFSGPTAELVDRPDLLRAVFLAGTGEGARSAASDIAVTHGPALEATGLTVNFGGIRAVDDVSLRVDDHEIVGLIGPNGAGKSTVFDLLSGFVPPTAGRVALAGVDVTTMSPQRRAIAGLGRTFQDARLFPAMTVRETIAVAEERGVAVRDPVREALWMPSAFDAEEAVAKRADEIMDLLNLTRYGDSLVRELSTGTKRVVELACALAHRPSVVLLDEPSTGLSQREAEAMQALLLVLREQLDAAFLIIEHDTALLEAVADRIIALDLGRVIADGRASDVLHDPLVLSCYLGSPSGVVGAAVR
jgi:branched-chain amino acid transport system permease protein